MRLLDSMSYAELVFLERVLTADIFFPFDQGELLSPDEYILKSSVLRLVQQKLCDIGGDDIGEDASLSGSSGVSTHCGEQQEDQHKPAELPWWNPHVTND